MNEDKKPIIEGPGTAFFSAPFEPRVSVGRLKKEEDLKEDDTSKDEDKQEEDDK